MPSRWALSTVGRRACRAYDHGMGDGINLMDPEFEPTDEQLIGLSKRAFAGVRAEHEAALTRMRARIRVDADRVLADLRARGVLKGK